MKSKFRAAFQMLRLASGDVDFPDSGLPSMRRGCQNFRHVLERRAGYGIQKAGHENLPSSQNQVTATGELWVFAGLIVLGQFSPGPDMVLLTRTALREGWQNGVKMALGIASGLAVHSTIAVAGMAVMYQRLPTLRLVLQWLAAFYLLWLAYGLLKAAFASLKASLPTEVPASRHPPFLRGLLCNLCNPKAALFLAAVCAPFLAGKHPTWWPFAIWGVIVGLGISLWSAWVILLQWPPLRSRYERAGGWIDGIFGIALVALALRLMVGW